MTIPNNLHSIRLRRSALGFAITAVAITLGGASAMAGETVLYSFCSLANCADGAHPLAGLILDGSGNLYGTTVGSRSRKGQTTGSVVFEFAPGGIETVLHTFTDIPDGARAEGTLIADSLGNLYATTFAGGTQGDGTVFEVAPNGSSENVLYSFCSLADCSDGANPQTGSLVMDSSGNLYGETSSGGSVPGNGTIFELEAGGGGEATLYTFCAGQNGCPDGSLPLGGLTRDSSGNLYGTTNGGGANDFGTVFKFAPGGFGSESTLYSFAGGSDGAYPAGGVIDVNGTLYGTTQQGGANNCPNVAGCGTVFSVNPTTMTETVLYSFQGGSDGVNPEAGLLADSAGNLYGTTYEGGGAANCGIVFKLAPNGAETVLYTFQGGTDGCNPSSGLIADKSGNVYGTTGVGGTNSFGTVFELADVIPEFAGTPGQPNCYGQSVSALANQYGGLPAAAAALGYPNVKALQAAIKTYCQ